MAGSPNCQSHHNPASHICLHPECPHRLMCLLCQHSHSLFPSLRTRSHVQLPKFIRVIEQSIDASLAILDGIERGGIERERKLVAAYYDSVKADLLGFIDMRMNENLAVLGGGGSGAGLQELVRARIQGRYHNIPAGLFARMNEVYEGKDLQTMARQEQQQKLEAAYLYMQTFHQQCTNLFNRFHLEITAKLPQIRLACTPQPPAYHPDNYSEQPSRAPLQHLLVHTTSEEDIDMPITDAYSGRKEIITVGYDKCLRVFDKELKKVHVKEYNNIITRIEPIGEDVYALGVSKQLHIARISHQEGYQPKEILRLKGHGERIADISALNTRIVGSCSQEGVKIWDLYKQRCEYTLRSEVNPSCLRFMPMVGMLAVGYHNHQLKIYSINTMKPTRAYQLSGLPLCLSQQNQNQHLIYCGGFGSDLRLLDMRVGTQVFNVNFKSEAVTCFKQCIFDEESLLVGERGGKVRIFDLRQHKTRIEWQAHHKTSNLSRPNGVVRVFEERNDRVLTVGCNDKKASIWAIKKQ